MQHAVGGVHDPRGLGNRLKDTGLIVGRHQGDQNRRGDLPQHPFERREVDDPVGVDGNDGHGVGGKAAAGHHRRVLDGGNEQAREPDAAAVELHHWRQSRLVRLGAAAGEGDGRRRDVAKRGHGGAGVLDQPVRGAPFGMDRGRVADERQGVDDRIARGRRQRRTRVPVEEDPALRRRRHFNPDRFRKNLAMDGLAVDNPPTS